MRIASMIARILLGAIFILGGSNHVFKFLPQPPLPPGQAGQFLGVMIASGYLAFVGICETVAGLFLLINRFVPLALTVLAAVITNIFVTSVLFQPKALPVGLVLTVLWILAAYRARTSFLPLLQQRVAD